MPSPARGFARSATESYSAVGGPKRGRFRRWNPAAFSCWSPHRFAVPVLVRSRNCSRNYEVASPVSFSGRAPGTRAGSECREMLTCGAFRLLGHRHGRCGERDQRGGSDHLAAGVSSACRLGATAWHRNRWPWRSSGCSRVLFQCPGVPVPRTRRMNCARADGAVGQLGPVGSSRSATGRTEGG